MECQIQANPDIAGIGVRFSIYFQALFGILSTVIRFYAEGDVPSREDLESSTLNNSKTIIFTGLAIAISGTIQAANYGLTVYHALLLLDLCWVIVIGAVVPFFVILLTDSKGGAKLTTDNMVKNCCGVLSPNYENSVATRLSILHCLHFTITSCVGLWVFIFLRKFDTSARNCTSSTVAVIVGYEYLVTSPIYRTLSLTLYAIFSLPLLNMVLAQIILQVIPGTILLIVAIVCGPIYKRVVKLDMHDLLDLISGPVLLSAPFAVIVLIIISTEQTILANNVTLGEDQWTLGQTVALAAAFISTFDFLAWLWRKWSGRPHFIPIDDEGRSLTPGSEGFTVTEFVNEEVQRLIGGPKTSDRTSNPETIEKQEPNPNSE